MRILFVDDEPRILEGIERMLFHKADEWEIICLTSGEAAMAELESARYDVIVTDMRMPGMDGAAVLREVHQRYPGLIRIVLSGYTELEAAARAVPVAHQFLTKPCSAEVLEEVIRRACSLQELLSDEAIKRAVGHIDSLPSAPRVYTELTQALADPRTDAKTVSHIIGRDPAMSAKILQLVNSSFFGRPAKITSIQLAVVCLGFRMVKNLALSVEVFVNPPAAGVIRGFSIDELQNHSLHTAALSTLILDDRHAANDAFMAGMLHDIGKLILAAELPARFAECLSLARTDGRPLHAVEKEMLGITHAEIGACLLGVWGLPYPIVEAVASHHAPERVPLRSAMGVLEAVHVADCLVRGNPLNPFLTQELELQDKLADWSRLAEVLDQGNGVIQSDD